MAISYVGGDQQSSLTANGGANNISVTMPTIQAGDVAILMLSKSNAETLTTNPTISGFTQYEFDNTSFAGFSSNLWYKRLNGTESGTIIGTAWATIAYTSIGLAVFRGVDPSQLFNAAITKQTTTASTTTNFNLTSTTWPNAEIVYAIADIKSASTSAGFTHTPPAGATERVDISSTRNNSLNTGIQISHLTKGTAGSVASTTGTAFLAVNGISYTLALQESISVSPSLIDGSSTPPNPTVAATYTVGPTPNTTIPTGASVPNPSVNQPNVLVPSAIGTAESVPNPSSSTTITVTQNPTILTGASVPNPVSNTTITVIPTSVIPTGASVPSPTATYYSTHTPTAIPTGQSVPNPSFNVIQTVSGAGNIVGGAIYNPTVAANNTLLPQAIISQEAVYEPSSAATVTITIPYLGNTGAIYTPSTAYVEESWSFLQLT